MSPRHKIIRAAVATACFAIAGGPAMAADAPIVGLITKTDTNPFFVRMREGAKARAGELGVEPCNRCETHLVNTVADAVEIIERVAADNVFVHPDSYHMNIEEVSMARGIADTGGHPGYVHASEANRGVPGRGCLDRVGLCQGLAKAEFEGPVVLESFVHLDPDAAAGLAVWRPVAERPEEVIDVGLPFLREHAAAAGLPLQGAAGARPGGPFRQDDGRVGEVVPVRSGP